MKQIFVDTSGWASLADSRQSYHHLTRSIFDSAKISGIRLITTNYVFAEPVALLTSPMRIDRGSVIAYVESIKASSFVDVVHIDRELDENAFSLLRDRLDKNWSLVDCSSFVVMQDNRITEALTTDHHFEQAGFVRLLK